MIGVDVHYSAPGAEFEGLPFDMSGESKGAKRRGVRGCPPNAS